MADADLVAAYSLLTSYLHLLICLLFLFHRPKTVFEVISELWNSPDFNPVAPAS
jgi:hypothetical protein